MSVFFYLLFIFVPLIWLPNTSELFEFNKLIFTYILTTLIVSTWAIRMIMNKKIIFRKTSLDWPILIFLISQFLSLLFSIDPHVSWFGYYSRWNGGLLSLISYSLLYWAFVSNMDQKSTLYAIRYTLYAAIIIAVYASLEHFGASVSCLLTTGSFDVTCWVQDVQNRVFATLGQPNWLAAYLTALIFIPISLYLSPNPSPKLGEGERKGVRYLWAAITILMFTTLLFTKSRSALLAFGISSLVFWGITLLRPPLTAKPRTESENLRGGNLKGVILFSIICFTFTLIIPNPLRDLVLKTRDQRPTASQGTVLESGGTESGAIRKIVWTGALRIWQANPKNFLIGTGPETFAESYYQYRPVEHNQTSEWELLYNKAHNEFLNYLATAGLLGFLSYLFLLGSMTFIYLSPFRSPSPGQRPERSENLGEGLGVRYALFCGWLTIIVTNFWGFSVVIMQLFLFLFPAIAIVIEDGERSRIHDQ